jgi:hypothetical protein
MLATVLHERHRLPTAQISRLIDLNYVSTGKHIAKLTPLFTEHRHPIAPTGNKTKKLEHPYATAALPQDGPTTRDATTITATAPLEPAAPSYPPSWATSASDGRSRVPS